MIVNTTLRNPLSHLRNDSGCSFHSRTCDGRGSNRSLLVWDVFVLVCSVPLKTAASPL